MNYKDININYLDYGNKNGNTVILLHGWGQNIAMMKPIGDSLSSDFRILIFDLPGFGESSEPLDSWDVTSYADMVNDICKKLKIINPILIGHSFGGRIAIKFASKFKTKKLILLSAPVRRNQSKKTTLKIKVFKILKKVPILNLLSIPAKSFLGSKDYNNASEIMRSVLVKTVNEDLTPLLSKIKCPTIMIYGTNDTDVPYSEAQHIASNINNVGLIPYEGNKHFAYLDRINQTNNVIAKFLETDKGGLK